MLHGRALFAYGERKYLALLWPSEELVFVHKDGEGAFTAYRLTSEDCIVELYKVDKLERSCGKVVSYDVPRSERVWKDKPDLDRYARDKPDIPNFEETRTSLGPIKLEMEWCKNES